MYWVNVSALFKPFNAFFCQWFDIFLAYEKSVVQWMPDNQAKECPFCRRSFTLTRRRHHCRLCGDIMCDKCSQFLPHTFASK